jgi:hypothetical protein
MSDNYMSNTELKLGTIKTFNEDRVSEFKIDGLQEQINKNYRALKSISRRLKKVEAMLERLTRLIQNLDNN